MNPFNPDQKITFYLSSQGDSISLRQIINQRFREMDIENDNIHPKLKEALTLRTHFAVLKFLMNIQMDEECLNSVNLYHHHNPKYRSHSLNIGFGMQKGAAHPCPIAKMIDFVKNQINILKLESVEEINEYLEENIPETECSFTGVLNLKFKEYTIDFTDFIKLFHNMINAPNLYHNPNSYHALLKKITFLYEGYKEKSKELNYLTRTLTQQNIQIISPMIDDFRFKFGASRVKGAESLEELV